MALPGTFYCSACNKFLPLEKFGVRKTNHNRCQDCQARAQAAQAKVTVRRQVRKQALSKRSEM